MTDTQALKEVAQRGAEMAGTWTNNEALIIHNMYAKHANQAEFMAFARICRLTQLDPMRSEIFCMIYNRNDASKRSMVIVTALAGFRKLGWATGEVIALEGPQWLTQEGDWVDVWTDESRNPVAAKFGIQRTPMIAPRWVTVTWKEFAKDPNARDGEFWKRMPAHMLAKVAESQAWRAVFPAQMNDLHDAAEAGDTMPPPDVMVDAIDVSEAPAIAAAPGDFDEMSDPPGDEPESEPEPAPTEKPKRQRKAKGITDGAIVGAVEVAIQVAQISEVQVAAVVGDDGVVAWVRAQMGDDVTVITMNQAIAQLASMAGEAEVEA